MLWDIVESRERRGRRYVGGRLAEAMFGPWRKVERKARASIVRGREGQAFHLEISESVGLLRY